MFSTEGVDRQEKAAVTWASTGVSFGTCTRGEPLGSYTQLHLCELSFLLNPAFTCRSAVCTLCGVYRCITLPDFVSLTRPPTVFEKNSKAFARNSPTFHVTASEYTKRELELKNYFTRIVV